MPKKKQKVQNAQLPVHLDKTTVAVNTCGLPIFPAELLMEIMTYFPRSTDPSLHDPSISRVLYAIEAEEHVAWRQTSLALSQTCKSLRLFFLPYLWRRIEVWEGMITQGQALTSLVPRLAVEKELNLELVRQLEIVTVRNPTLADYVQIVDVDVARYSDKSLLSELARCLSLFPNLRIVKLRTLRMDRHANGVPKMVEKAFGKYSYPQVSMAILSKWVYPFLSFCPKLQSVRWTDSNRYSPTFRKHTRAAVSRLQLCTQLKSLAFRGEDGEWLADTVKVLPNLRHIVLNCDSSLLYFHLESSLTSLKGLKHLQKVEFLTNWSVSQDLRNLIIVHTRRLLNALQEEDGEMKEIIIGQGRKSELTRESIIIPAPKPSA